MLLSFQRPSHLFRKAFFLSGAPGSGLTVPGRTDNYSARHRCRRGFAIWPEAVRCQPRSAYDLDADRAFSGTIVEVEQHDLLPGSERQSSVDHGDRLRGTDQRRPLMGVRIGVVVEPIVLV